MIVFQFYINLLTLLRLTFMWQFPVITILLILKITRANIFCQRSMYLDNDTDFILLHYCILKPYICSFIGTHILIADSFNVSQNRY